MPAKRPDPGLEQWRRRVEAAETSKKAAEQKPTEDVGDEEPEKAEVPRTSEEQDQRPFWEFKPRPYWR